MNIVPKKLTRVGTPWNHEQIINGMNDVLINCGVSAWSMRRKMIAHHVIACGWRQNCWNHNAWSVRVGKSWNGDAYAADTQEDDGTGRLVADPGALWRSFPGWQSAVDDYLARINAENTWSDGYRKAGAMLRDPNSSDREYWLALMEGGYATDTKIFADGKGYASICNRVEVTVSTSKKKLK